jgi:hypothetical protein
MAENTVASLLAIAIGLVLLGVSIAARNDEDTFFVWLGTFLMFFLAFVLLVAK